MLKFFVGMMLVAFSSFIGYKFAGKYKKRKLFYSQICDFNERFMGELAYYRRPLHVFLFHHRYRGEFQILIEEFYAGLKNADLFANGVFETSLFSFLTNEEKEEVKNHFQMLGKGDSGAQKNYFSSVKEQWIYRRNNAESNCKKYADLYVKLGFLFGLFILVLIM